MTSDLSCHQPDQWPGENVGLTRNLSLSSSASWAVIFRSFICAQPGWMQMSGMDMLKTHQRMRKMKARPRQIIPVTFSSLQQRLKRCYLQTVSRLFSPCWCFKSQVVTWWSRGVRQDRRQCQHRRGEARGEGEPCEGTSELFLKQVWPTLKTKKQVKHRWYKVIRCQLTSSIAPRWLPRWQECSPSRVFD